MKIGVIIGGLSRNFKDTLPYFKNMLNKQTVDTFIFTWSDLEDTEILRVNYKPKVIASEKYSDFSNFIDERINFFESIPYHRTGNYNLKTGLMAQHYTLKKAFDLIEDVRSYDIIIRYRFDWTPRFVLDFEKIYELNKNKLLYSFKKTNGFRPHSKYLINDMFAVAKPEHMKVYCSIFDAMMTDGYIDDVIRTTCFIPEYIMALHLNRNNVPTGGYDFPYVFNGRKFL